MKPEGRRVSDPRRLPSSSFNVGLVWAAGDWDPGRAVPLGRLAPLGGIEGVARHGAGF